MRGEGFKGGLPVILAACIGVVVAIGVGFLSIASERRLTRVQLEDRVADEFSNINHELSNSFATLPMLRVFFESSTQPISRTEFKRASRPVRHLAPGMQLIGWAPRVTQPERENFEQAMRETGLAGFEIRDRSPQGAMVHAADRPVHYPLLYEEASTGTAFTVIGSDLPSNAVRLRAIDKAITTDQVAATPPYAMPQPGSPVGLIAYMAVFRSASDEPAAPAQPDGLVFAIYELAKMLDGVIAETHALSDLDTYMFDPAATPSQRLAYWRPGDGRQGPPPTEAAFRLLPHVEAKVRLLDQTLVALVVPVGKLARVGWKWESLEPSAIILFITAIIVACMVLSLRRAQQLSALAANLRDTTDGLQKKAATIAHMARHDALTGLPNRIFFAEALSRNLAEDVPCAILQIGLDRFRAVNEFHGHAVGDMVLREVAKRVRAATRSSALVARLGGDEFALMIEDCASSQAGSAIARRLIEAITLPIEIDHGCIVVGATVGIAFHPVDGTEAEKLLRAADLAMDAAKQKEPGSLCLFEPGMQEDVRSRLALEADLRSAIENGDIKPYYQPVMRLQDASLVGFEILARWHHPERGIVMPDAFIGLAESTGLIADMTYSLLRHAAADAQHWPAHLYLALNISPLHLKKGELPNQILSILQQTGTDPLRLEVEITETALLSSMDVAKKSLLTLQRAGVRVALDDFGTGYSSLVHLRQLPLNKIKIDRSFVSHLLDDLENRKIVAAIVGLGKSLGIAVTAEGIETKEVALMLAALGCDFGQGYFFAKPMAADAVAKLHGFDALELTPKRADVGSLDRGPRLQMSDGGAR
jgi:diguanylate cyclase (GGDEF)-like protein